jgi:glutamyl-tRNA synthetase
VAELEPFEQDAIGKGLLVIGENNTTNGKAGPFLGRMRYAVTGQKVSPPLFESMLAMGREEVLARLDHALEVLSAG